MAAAASCGVSWDWKSPMPLLSEMLVAVAYETVVILLRISRGSGSMKRGKLPCNINQIIIVGYGAQHECPYPESQGNDDS